MATKNKTHVYVTFPSSGEVEVFPDNDKLLIGWEKDNDVWRKAMSTKLSFANKLGPASQKVFDMFAALELEACDCHKLDMRVTLECPGEVEETIFQGTLFFIDGEWFFDFCRTEIKPRTNDPFACLFKNWETDTNLLLDTGDFISLATDTGNFGYDTCFHEYSTGIFSDYFTHYESSCLDDPSWDWQPIEHSVFFIDDDKIQVLTKWVREEFIGAGPPPGAGWTQRAPTLWTRPAILQGPVIEQSDVDYFATWTLISKTLDNGRLLSAVMTKLFSVCGDHGLRSDFLGIDPDGSAPANQAYDYAQAYIWGAVVFSMSDVVNSGAFENATAAHSTLHKMMDCMRENWRIFLFFDDANDVYRIEHNSYERFSNLINFVTKKPDAIRGFNTYTYDKKNIPQKETYSWQFQTNDPDWDSATILYDDCNDEGNIQDHKIDCYHTDFQSLIGSGIDDIDILKGLVIVSAKDGQIDRAIGEISHKWKLNAGLSWANVVRNLWRWRMPTCAATVNGTVRNFLSRAPIIRGKQFDAELCCMDLHVFNPATDKIRTGLGNGEVDAHIEFDLGTGLASWDLLYAPPITIVDLSISINVDDDTQCYYTPFTFKTNEHFPPGVDISWNFGAGAIPATATGEGPHLVQYTTTGTKTITVTAEYNGETNSATTTVTVMNCPGQITGNVSEVDTGGIQSVNVKLFNDVDGNGVSDGGSPVKNVFTNSSGNFAMAGLVPGNYVIVLTLPVNYTLVSGQDISPDGDMAPDFSTTDLVIPVTVHPSVIDAGNNFVLQYNLGIVKGSVKKPGGAGVNGVQVKIYADNNLDGVKDNTTVVAIGVTNASGLFTINAVPLGEYVMECVIPGGYHIVSGQDNSPDGDNPTDISITDNVIPLTITFSKTDTDNDFVIDN